MDKILIGPRAAAGLGYAGLILLALAVSTSFLTFNWVIEHHPEANLFPEFTGRVIYLSDIFLFAGLATWAIGWYSTPGRSIQCGPRYLFLPLLFLVFMTILSVAWAENATLAIFTAARRVLLLGLYLAMVTEARRNLAPVAVALFAVAFLHSGVALAQMAKGAPVGLPQLGEVAHAWVGQPYGLAFNPNPAGLFLAVVSTLAYGLFLTKEGGWKVRAWTLGCFLIPFSGLVATSSRSAFLGGLLGVFVVTLIAWLWSGPARRRLLGNRVGAGGLSLVVAGGLYLLFLSAAGNSDGGDRSWVGQGLTRVLRRLSLGEVSQGLEGREIDWAFALPIIQEHPLLGVGAGNYPQALKASINPNAVGGIYTPPHNVLLLFLAELGVFGAVAWALIMAAPLVWFLLQWRFAQERAPPAGLSSLLWLGPLVVILFEGIWDFPTWATQDGRVLTMAVLGLWAGGAGTGRGAPEQAT